MQSLMPYFIATISEEIVFSSASVIYITTKWWASPERGCIILKNRHLCQHLAFHHYQWCTVSSFPLEVHELTRVTLTKCWYSMCWPKTRKKNGFQQGNLHVCKHNQRCWNIHRMKSWLVVAGVSSLYGVCIFYPAISASKCVPHWEIDSHLLLTLLSFFPIVTHTRAHTRTRAHAHTQTDAAGLVAIAG